MASKAPLTLEKVLSVSAGHLAVGAPAALATDSLLHDYTGLPLAQRAAIIGTSIVGGELLRRYDNAATTTKQAIRNAGITVAASAGIGAALAATLSGYTVSNNFEYAALLPVAYGAWRGARKAATWVSEKLEHANKRTRAVTAAAAIGATAIGAAAEKNVFDIARYEPISRFTKEGITGIDPQKAAAAGIKVQYKLGGPIATGHLEPRSTVYSFVLKNTDYTKAEDVMAAADTIAARSGITDFRKVPPTHELRMPVELLSERFNYNHKEPAPAAPKPLPSPKTTIPSAQPRVAKRDDALSGMHIILDAGHGGIDPGSSLLGQTSVTEDELSYDIYVRTLRGSKTHNATVYPLVFDRNTGYTPLDILTQTRNEQVLVTPAYTAVNRHHAAQLRLFKTAQLQQQLMAQGVPRENIVFISIHSDAISPKFEGMMVYYPSKEHRPTSIHRKNPVFEKIQEPRALDYTVRFEGSKQHSEDLSASLAQYIVAEADANAVKVHDGQPVRGVIHQEYRTRKGKKTVTVKQAYNPMVLNNAGDINVLVEVGNGKNANDSRKLMDPAYRENIAQTIVNGLIRYRQNGGTR
jgi:N-acetylmuramoyl-L-alanine amidase